MSRKTGTCAVIFAATKPKQTKNIGSFLVLSIVSHQFLDSHTQSPTGPLRKEEISEPAMIDACESNFSNGGKNEENARGCRPSRSRKWKMKCKINNKMKMGRRRRRRRRAAIHDKRRAKNGPERSTGRWTERLGNYKENGL
jgi:hypothetical protein